MTVFCTIAEVSLGSLRMDRGCFRNCRLFTAWCGLSVDSGKLWRSGNVHAEADAGFGGTPVERGLGGTVSLLDDVSPLSCRRLPALLDDSRQGASVMGGPRASF